MLAKGYIQVYSGDGKGKTTAALGQAFRSIGRGLKVFIVQFMKAPDSAGEHFSAQAFKEKLTIKPMGRPGFIHPQRLKPEDRMKAQAALEEARAAMLSQEYDVVVLDEVNIAVYFSLLEVQELVKLLDEKPPQVELILTGRNAHPDIIAKADLVSEVKEIKHYYQQGIKAREGIES